MSKTARSTGSTHEVYSFGGSNCSVSRAACLPLTSAVLMYMCQQITGAALSAFLPSLMTDLGFSGANAQLATLGPYGAAMVVSISFERFQKGS